MVVLTELQLPISFIEIAVWLTITAIILLFTLEIVSNKYGQINLIIDRVKLDQITRVFAIFAIFINLMILIFNL